MKGIPENLTGWVRAQHQRFLVEDAGDCTHIQRCQKCFFDCLEFDALVVDANASQASEEINRALLISEELNAHPRTQHLRINDLEVTLQRVRDLARRWRAKSWVNRSQSWMNVANELEEALQGATP